VSTGLTKDNEIFIPIRKPMGKLYEDMSDSDGFWWIREHLDEAKADFPKMLTVDENEFSFEFYRSDEVTAWYKKWFGEVD
jgi:hypothetical protein